MDFFIIILTLLIIGGGTYYMLRVPYEIEPLAENAGFPKYSLRYKMMKFRKLPIKYLLEQYVRAMEVNVALDFEDLKDYFLIYGDLTENMINVLIKAKRAGVRVTINELEKFEISGGNSEQLVKALKVVKNASVDISRDVLETHSLYGGNIETFVEIILRANKANLVLNLQDLVEENLSDEDMRKIVNILIKVKKAELFVTDKELAETKYESENPNYDLRISQKNLFEHFRANIDIEKYANAMITAKKAGIEIDKKALNIHYLTDGDMEKLVGTMIKADKAGLNITQTQLVQNNLEGKDVGRLVKYVIKAKQAEIDLSADELVEFHRIGGDSETLVTALIISKKANLGIGKKELEDHHLAGADVLEYVKTRKFISDFNLNISVDDLNAHYLKGGHMLKSIMALMFAIKNNIVIQPATLLSLDLVETFDISEIVRWAVNPQVQKVEPAASVVVRDGIQISLKINVTIRGKIDLYTTGSREAVLFGRINEAVAEEIPNYETYTEVLKNLNKISENILNKLNGDYKLLDVKNYNKFEIEDITKFINQRELKLNQSSAYEVLDIKVFDLIVGEDTLADFKIKNANLGHEISEIHAKEHAIKMHAEEVEAKIRFINAKAQVQEGLAEAFKNSGTDQAAFDRNFRKYQTEKNIFDAYDDDKTTGGKH